MPSYENDITPNAAAVLKGAKGCARAWVAVSQERNTFLL